MADDLEHFPDPIEILDFEVAGRKVVEWAQNPRSRPRDIEEFKEQLKDAIRVPPRYKEIQIVQGYDHVFFLRLPPNNQVTQSLAKLQTEDDDVARYGIPDFYFDAINQPDEFDREKFFYSRIADYTIRGCR